MHLHSRQVLSEMSREDIIHVRWQACGCAVGRILARLVRELLTSQFGKYRTDEHLEAQVVGDVGDAIRLHLASIPLRNRIRARCQLCAGAAGDFWLCG